MKRKDIFWFLAFECLNEMKKIAREENHSLLHDSE
jgi:hypothetical protein